MALPATFFDTVVADIAETYEIKVDGQIVENDPVVRMEIGRAHV